MKRLLIIPAAGTGSRLGSSVPKVLYPLAGRPLLDHLADLYRPMVDCIVLVLHPSAAAQVRDHCARQSFEVEIAFQPKPTGMLPALLAPHDIVSAHRPQQVWATWCDQVAIHPRTASRLAEFDAQDALVFPTARRARPYIHFLRDETGRIIDVLHQREGDPMPELGESDAGLFRFSLSAYLELLPAYAREAAIGSETAEANFLPFIPWLAGRAAVRTFPVVDEMESVGINTIDDVRRVEGYLRGRN